MSIHIRVRHVRRDRHAQSQTARTRRRSGGGSSLPISVLATQPPEDGADDERDARQGDAGHNDDLAE